MKTVEVKNLGPIQDLTIKFAGPGVTVVRAPNGKGKSILLDGVSKVVANGGKLPLRDGEKRGHIEAFGARISIGATCRHTGEAEVTHLEGRFDLASLVDPGVKTPDAADRHRIKALVTLMGVKANINLFADSAALGGRELFAKHVTLDAVASEDPVEMAAKIKKAYEAAARKQEDLAQQELGKAVGLEDAIRTIDTSLEHDSGKLTAEYDAALRLQAELQERARQAENDSQRIQEARQSLETAKANYTGPSVAQAAIDLEKAQNDAAGCDEKVEKLRLQLQQAEKERDEKYLVIDQRRRELHSAREYKSLLDRCEETLRQRAVAPVLPAELTQVAERITAARQAIEQGAIIRKAKEQQQEAEQHRAKQAECLKLAETLREAAKGTDEVLSAAIQCETIRVESLDGVARLVVDHPVRGKSKPFHELSEGEKWRIAIDIAADRVGEQGLIVLAQEAWEALDVAAREAIHQHARERSVFVLTGEATRDPSEMTQGLIVEQFKQQPLTLEA